jgi:hypothetical protein
VKPEPADLPAAETGGSRLMSTKGLPVVGVIPLARAAVGAQAQGGRCQVEEDRPECNQFHAGIIGPHLDKSKSMCLTYKSWQLIIWRTSSSGTC